MNEDRASLEAAGLMQHYNACPKITIVTPSFNQVHFLEESILSVLGQDYSNLEHIVIDGGSSDGSVEILRRYERHFAYWVSEPDEGQYYAIQRGFSRSTGEIMAWINSDDMYTPWAFELIREIFVTFPEVEWITTAHPLTWGEKAYPVSCHFAGSFNAESFLKGANLPGGAWHARSFIQQESTFWRRSLWEKAGGCLDTSLELAADFELWCRFFKFADLYAVDAPLSGFRKQPDQKTAHHMAAYIGEAATVLRKHGVSLPGKTESLLRKLINTAIGPRSLKKIPSYVGRFLSSCGLLYPTKVLVYDYTKRSWKIVTDYVI